jgi:hypothetical protein
LRSNAPSASRVVRCEPLSVDKKHMRPADDQGGARFHVALRSIFGLLCSIALCYSVLLGWEALLLQSNSLEKIRIATTMIPVDANSFARLAHLDLSERPRLIRRALTLNPYDASLWTEAGITAENLQHDAASAEEDFVRATQVDHTFLPSWALASFYLRHHDARFSEWVRRALTLIPYSAAPVLGDLWVATNHDYRKMAEIVPDRPQVLLDYVVFLLNLNELDEVTPIAKRTLIAHPRPGDDLGLLNRIPQEISRVVDRLVATGRIQPALNLWGSIRDVGWTDLAVPSGSSPLSNGDFQKPISGHGFDWMVVPLNGVRIRQLGENAGVAINLDGSQPETCQILLQYLPLLPKHRYRMTWELGADDVHEPSGLNWHILKITSETESASLTGLTSADLSGSAGGSKVWEFTVPGDATVSVLSLDYSRPLGVARSERVFSLKSVRMAQV